MAEHALTTSGESTSALPGLPGVVSDWSADKQAFPVPWGKALMLITAAFGATFVGMQAFEWTKLIREGVRPWGNPLGATQFGSCFFMITGFHGLHVSAGVVYLTVVALRVWRGFYDRKGSYETVEITGLYWHFVDLVWVFIFAFFYLW